LPELLALGLYHVSQCESVLAHVKASSTQSTTRQSFKPLDGMQIVAHVVLLVNDTQNITGFSVDSMRHAVYVPSVDLMHHHVARACGLLFFST